MLNNSSAPSLRWLISQIGTRELYACPVSFQRRGTLRKFYTDVWCPSARELVGRLPGSLKLIARRHHSELPADKVESFTLSSLFAEFRRKLSGKQSTHETFKYFEQFGAAFSRRVAKRLAQLKLDPRRDVLLAFCTGALESLQTARSHGLTCVLDQLDPGRVDAEMVNQECQRWPEWDRAPGAVPESYYQRLAQEWENSDLIIVNSEFSRQAIHKQGVPLHKLVVVPLAYEPEGHAPQPRPPHRNGPLHVLWLGQIVLRKGIPYLFEAARLLEKENIRFTVAGTLGISEKAIQSAPGNLTVRGKVSREEAVQLFQTADVFVLPTISDGFALTQIEAMSHGMPVVATSHCGDVVTHGQDGYIIPIRDPHALADAIMRFARDPALVSAMSARAIEKSRMFTVDRYAQTIEDAVRNFRSSVNQSPANQPPAPMTSR